MNLIEVVAEVFVELVGCVFIDLMFLPKRLAKGVMSVMVSDGLN